MKRRNVILWFSLILILAMIGASGCAPKPQNATAPSDPNPPAVSSAAQTDGESAKTGPFKGMQAPDFTLKDMSGTEWTLSQLKGNSVAMVFFTSW